MIVEFRPLPIAEWPGMLQAYVGGYNWLLAVYYSAYKELTVNVFALSSTWLTVVMAVSRYVVVCRPLHARGYISLRRTRCSLLAVFLLSVVVNFPRALRYSVVTQPCFQLGLASDNQTRHCDCVLYNKVNVDQSINLFAIKGHRPLTYHTNSTNIHITTKRKYKIIPVMEIK